MQTASTVFPSTVIQHEDFYSEAAFAFLERYQDKYRMFNDDIQGYVPARYFGVSQESELIGRTGSVILAGFIRAAKQASEASGRPLKDHKVVFLGGGSAAVG